MVLLSLTQNLRAFVVATRLVSITAYLETLVGAELGAVPVEQVEQAQVAQLHHLARQ